MYPEFEKAAEEATETGKIVKIDGQSYEFTRFKENRNVGTLKKLDEGVTWETRRIKLDPKTLFQRMFQSISKG